MFTLVDKHKERTYASVMSSRMKPWEYGTRHVFKISPAAFAALQMCSADARYFFTHNFLITAAFISETCESSLTSTYTKVFLFVTSKSSEPGFVVEAGIIANCLGKFLVENSILRRHFGQY